MGQLANKLHRSAAYVVIALFFKDWDKADFQKGERFRAKFSAQLIEQLIESGHTALAKKVARTAKEENNKLSSVIGATTSDENLKCVLIIDDADLAIGYHPYYNLRGVVRSMFNNRYLRPTFHCVVQSAIINITVSDPPLEDGEHGYPPFNIVAPYEVDFEFTSSEIDLMLQEYCRAEGVKMDIQSIAAQLFHHTSGHPWLVSALCKILTEEILPEKDILEKELLKEDVGLAVFKLFGQTPPLFNLLIQVLHQNPGLCVGVQALLVEKERLPFDRYVYRTGIDYGILKPDPPFPYPQSYI